MNSTSIKTAMAELAKKKLATFEQMPFRELSGLPPMASEDLEVEGAKVILSVWHDQVDSRAHRIVVQVYLPGIVGGRMFADGFVAYDDHERRKLTVDEWAPFN